jgi:hypothetical protein
MEADDYSDDMNIPDDPHRQCHLDYILFHEQWDDHPDNLTPLLAPLETSSDVVYDDMKYCKIQETLYNTSFSLDSLQKSTDLQSFVDLLPPYTAEDSMIASLLAFQKKAGLSRECGNELLSLINSFNPQTHVPSDWRTITSKVSKNCEHLAGTTLRRTVSWPASFKMHLFDEPGHDTPVAIELIARDPLELIAYKLVCPTTQYINKEQYQYSYVAETLDDGTTCHSNLMSSNFAKYSEQVIKGYNPAGILIPIVTYADGVCLGVRNKVTNDLNY